MRQAIQYPETANANTIWQKYNEKQRHYDDTTTWLAEVLDGSMRTAFEYEFDGQELYGRDGSALGQIFNDSIEDAELLVRRNPHLAFELRRRVIESKEYDDMLAMANGELPNTMVVISDFPPELMGLTQDIGGYNSKRKQTMLRVITRNENGTLSMVSQSLDRSDRQALEAVYGYFGIVPKPGELLGQRIYCDLPDEEQAFLPDWLTGVYDRSLEKQYGGEWHGGRTPAEMYNTYDFVRTQHDLVDSFVEVKLRDPSYAEGLRFGLAAAMDARFKKRLGSKVIGFMNHQQAQYYSRPIHEMEQAGMVAQAQGKTFSGCGLSTGKNNEQSTHEQLAEAGIGNKTSGKESWEWKNGVCRVSNCPTRPAKTKVGPCSVCAGCQYLYDKGKKPDVEYKLRRLKAGSN